MKPITLLLRRSNKLMILLIAGGLFFNSLLFLLTMPLAIMIIFPIAVLLLTAYFVMDIALLNFPWSWESISVNKIGVCKLTQRNGRSFEVYIQPDSFVSSYLTILHVVPEAFRWFRFWQHRYVMLLEDNTDAELFRKLRVYLLWHKNSLKHDSNFTTLED